MKQLGLGWGQQYFHDDNNNTNTTNNTNDKIHSGFIQAKLCTAQYMLYNNFMALSGVG